MELRSTLMVRWRPRLAWLSFGLWLACRVLALDGGLPLRTEAWTGPLVFFYVDASGLALVLALWLWRDGLSRESGWRAAWMMAAALSVQLFLLATERYVTGASRAWDLANYVQPMWRAALVMGRPCAAYEGRAVWADHGAFAMFAFAPLTRLGGDATVGLFVTQSLLAGASALVAYGLGLALQQPAWVALACASLLASSRALAQAARFDFHAECALPVLLLGAAWMHTRGRLAAALLLSIAACALRDVAAMTMAMLWLYWAVSQRSRTSLLAAAGCATVAVLDIVWLPVWTGWQSYVAMHGSAPLALSEALATTFLRCLSTFGVGWLHPIAWLVGAPWVVAAAVSPKLLVKGIDFQYGFLFVPVAVLGALQVMALLRARQSRIFTPAVLTWVALSVAANAPLASAAGAVGKPSARFANITSRLAALVPRDASVAADACAAPYVMERAQLTLLCRLNGQLLQARGLERWDEQVPGALDVSHLVVRHDCEASGPCARALLERAQHELGFRVVGSEGPFVVLRRSSHDVRP